MTNPEFSKCDVRGPSIDGMAGDSSVVGLVCFDKLQFAGILQLSVADRARRGMQIFDRARSGAE